MAIALDTVVLHVLDLPVTEPRRGSRREASDRGVRGAHVVNNRRGHLAALRPDGPSQGNLT